MDQHSLSEVTDLEREFMQRAAEEDALQLAALQEQVYGNLAGYGATQEEARQLAALQEQGNEAGYIAAQDEALQRAALQEQIQGNQAGYAAVQEEALQLAAQQQQVHSNLVGTGAGRYRQLGPHLYGGRGGYLDFGSGQIAEPTRQSVGDGEFRQGFLVENMARYVVDPREGFSRPRGLSSARWTDTSAQFPATGFTCDICGVVTQNEAYRLQHNRIMHGRLYP
ncbi:uncharacterized protein LY89DRAFT_674107 [Mollisia scopiformis]|uniref:C2H2-type domain-containing protein n=1 Tax=Mollisia scopiformis TaxID=149040 RepID=A0A194WU86_MOLSC|nr:uncharacterized protein LY89DRAFT_674107 [Mollisia scopiformis]KUJ11525.1 hypothetical protein LY89DRAFT_674107 [Mollisia scopiformis]